MKNPITPHPPRILGFALFHLLLLCLTLTTGNSQTQERGHGNTPRPDGGVAGLPSCPIATVPLNSTIVDAIPVNNTPDDLVRNILGAGVEIRNVQFRGLVRSAGTFAGGQNVIGFDSGIILSSGNIANVIGPNRFTDVSDELGLPGDPSLDGLIIGTGGVTFDATVLEFDFVPLDNTISFQYVFASDEYNEFANTRYNDVFGFFLNGQNVALLPTTTTSSSVVSINNVNGGNPFGTSAKNPLYYRNNDTRAICTEMDGLTVVLTVIASVTPNVVNHIKLAVADTSDRIYDSSVFIKGGSFTSELTVLDPNPVNDANIGYPSLVDDAGQIIVPSSTAAVDKLAGAPAVANGVTADGVTPLLLRFQSEVPVTFSMPCCTDGGLRQIADAETVRASSLTVTPVRDSVGRGWALATYIAPNNLSGDANTRTVTIQAQAPFLAQPSTRDLVIFRPPVVLVHGVWSKAAEWNDFRLFLLEQGYLHGDVAAVEYGDETSGDNAYGAGSFDPAATAPDDQVIVRRLITNIKQVLQARRTRRIAATQVDVVGHSMGGLVARSRVAFQAEPYRQLYNLKKGDIHKLITVGTPHQGTALADWLVKHKCDLVKDRLVLFPPRLVCSDRTFEQAFADRMMPIGKAIYGFQSSSAVIRRIGKTDVPSHAIAGIAPDDSDVESFFNSAVGHDCDDGSNTSVDALLGGNGFHDTVVPSGSQQGGIAGGLAFSSFSDLVHAFGNPGETAAPIIHAKVLQLLRTEPVSDAFQAVPAFVPTQIPVEPYACPPNAPNQGLRSLNVDPRISISPAPGTVFHPGDPVVVQMSVASGEPLETALFNVDGKLKAIQGPGPYEFTFTAPSDRAGRLDIIGGALSAFSATHIIIKPSTAPTSIASGLDTVVLGQMGESLPLKVTGNFGQAGDVDLSGGEAGTTYSTLSGGSNVVSVSSNGVVKARGSGEDTIVISHSGRSAVVLVRVNAFNRPPSVAPLPDVIMQAGEVVDIPVFATDPDGNPIALSIPVGPAFAGLINLANGNGIVHLAPPPGTPSGTNQVRVFATDNGMPILGAGQTFTVTLTNQPPVAKCKNVVVSADTNCIAGASIDDGSYAPDPDNTITIIQTPSGPYPLGTTPVTLTVTDPQGASSSCMATVTVLDTTPPQLTCPGPITIQRGDQPVALPVAVDNCDGVLTTTCVRSDAKPVTDPYPLGETTIHCSAYDSAMNGAGCTFTVNVTRLNQPPTCVAQITPQQCGITFPFSTDLFAISVEEDYVCLTLDGSASTDPDGDLLTIGWVIDTTNVVSGAVVTNCLQMGCHTITMVGNDGRDQCHQFLDLCVITPREAVEQCILVVDQMSLNRQNKRPLVVSLKAAKAAFVQDGWKRGAQMLSVFQSKVRAQVARQNPAEAALLIQSAQNILDALECVTQTPRDER